MNVATGWEWATHQPLIKAVMELYKPQFVLELGVGTYSTSIFKDSSVEYLGIENNKEWVDKIKCEFDVFVEWHDLGDIIEGTEYKDLTEQQKMDIIYFYANILIPEIRPRLLFVDQYTSCRLLSINSLGYKFDLIIYHDSESWKVNRYDLIVNKGFYLYELKTNGPCTMLMAREQKDLKNAIAPYIDSFMKEYSKCTEMYVDSREPV